MIDHADKTISFRGQNGERDSTRRPNGRRRGAKFKCLVCQQVAPDQYIKDEG